MYVTFLHRRYNKYDIDWYCYFTINDTLFKYRAISFMRADVNFVIDITMASRMTDVDKRPMIYFYNGGVCDAKA